MKSHFRLPGILAATAALLLTSGVTAASASTPQDTAKPERRTQNGADSYGWVRNANSAHCLAVPGASTDNGKGLIQWGCGTWRDHYWQFEYAFSSGGMSYYRVRNYNSGQCLAVPGASTTAGTQVIQWPCGTWPDHYWGIEYTNKGKRLVNWNSRQCLAVPGASTAQGEKVIQWPCGTWADHYWNF
ncbi:RICIN domain-containing protein [Streptomyces cinnamoneus]|uniref:RICIN domain-containing protein n=1 Tax=Streptomyces cinnamoneus TaxID=53446 RepID=UPI00167DAD49|nr:RICIN domain-containing protein [Streptomyces cinnamoneus]